MSKDIHTYYWPLLNNDARQLLSGDEAKHAIKVMRVNIGDIIRLIDGKGKEAIVRVEIMSKKDLWVDLLSINESILPKPVFHLAIAPTKQIDRLEWCLEKCTEIGLSRITPIICQNSERRHLRVDRLQRVAISAMKQSGSAYLPLVDEPIGINAFLDSWNEKDSLLIAHCRDDDKSQLSKTSNEVCVMIGPEGDFTLEEIERSQTLGAKAVLLGAKRLRTETAAVVACTIMNL